MSSFEFIIDQEVPLTFEGYLFNELKQVKKQSSSEFHFFHLVKDNKSFARLNLFIDNGLGKSPARAPFGSIEFTNDLEVTDLEYFVDRIEEYCRKKNLHKLYIVSYPACYSENKSKLLDFVFLNKGYDIHTEDINYHIPVQHSFEEKLHLSEKRRLKKCQKENFVSRKLEIGDLKKYYELVRGARERKGFPVSIQFQDLVGLYESFPDDYFCFSLWDKSTLVAASTGVRVSSEILYYFLPADHPDYRKFSPTVMLLKHMYDFCIENSYTLLDLGIATAGGVPNPGLIRFKENLGGIASMKYSFEKNLS